MRPLDDALRALGSIPADVEHETALQRPPGAGDGLQSLQSVAAISVPQRAQRCNERDQNRSDRRDEREEDLIGHAPVMRS